MTTLMLNQPVLGPKPRLALPTLKWLGTCVRLLVPVEVAHAAELGRALVACERLLTEVSVAVHGEVPAAGEALGAHVTHEWLHLLFFLHHRHLLRHLSYAVLAIADADEAVGILRDESDGVRLWECLAVHKELAGVAG